jgi:hypothetical protein
MPSQLARKKYPFLSTRANAKHGQQARGAVIIIIVTYRGTITDMDSREGETMGATCAGYPLPLYQQDQHALNWAVYPTISINIQRT